MIDSSHRNQVAMAVLQGMYSNGRLTESFTRTAVSTIEGAHQDVEFQDERIAVEVRENMVAYSFLIADEFLKQSKLIPKRVPRKGAEFPT